MITTIKSRTSVVATTICLAILAVFSLATAPAASAASDMAGPVMVSSAVTPKALNIATGPATVKVTIRLTDRTGTDTPFLVVSHDATGQSQGFGEMTLISGTTRDGTWQRSVTIPKGAATGAWTVHSFPDRHPRNRSTGFQHLATLNITATLPALAATPTPSASGPIKVGRTLMAVAGIVVAGPGGAHLPVV